MEERVALIVEYEDGRTTRIIGATSTSLVKGALHLIRVVTTTRIVPVSILWGLHKSERKVVDTKNELLAVFAPGRWVSAVAEGLASPYPAKSEAEAK